MVYLFLLANTVLAITVNSIVGFTWISSVLLATALIQNSCENIGKLIKHAAAAPEAEWNDAVRVPFTELATSLIPLLSNTWGATLGIVATCVAGFVVGKLPYSIERSFSPGVLLVFIPCVLGAIPGRISTSYNALLTQLSKERWTFDKNMIQRVGKNRNIAKQFTIEVKIGYTCHHQYSTYKSLWLVCAGLVLSLVGTAATVSTMINAFSNGISTGPGPTVLQQFYIYKA